MISLGIRIQELKEILDRHYHYIEVNSLLASINSPSRWEEYRKEGNKYNYEYLKESAPSLLERKAIKIVKFRIMYLLDIPLNQVPLYINSYHGFVVDISKWRLKNGI